MEKSGQKINWTLVGMLGLFCLAGALGACHKKDDPAVLSSGGGVASQSVITLKGAAQ